MLPYYLKITANRALVLSNLHSFVYHNINTHARTPPHLLTHPYPPSHTHTHKYKHMHALTHKTHACIHTCMHARAHTQAHARTHHLHTNTHTHHIHTCIQTRVHSHTHTHTHTYTHTDTHTHTRTKPLPPSSFSSPAFGNKGVLFSFRSVFRGGFLTSASSTGTAVSALHEHTVYTSTCDPRVHVNFRLQRQGTEMKPRAHFSLFT